MTDRAPKAPLRVLALEPYYGGSHRAVIDGLAAGLRPHGIEMEFLTLPARKWKWRVRGSAIVLAQAARERADAWREAHPHGEHGRPRGDSPWDVIYASTFVNLCEFLALAGDAAARAARVLYFHENQLVYPVRHTAEWDYHFPLVNITSALAADRCVFNSRYNRDSFLAEIPAFFRLFPDHRPLGVSERIGEKAEVVPPPFQASPIDACVPTRGSRPRVVWPHRWEHDKDPTTFLRVMRRLAREGIDFEVAIAGRPHPDSIGEVERAAAALGERVVHLGEPESREEYVRLLRSSDIAVSTALNEFFGLAMMEACYAGCAPLVPDRLAYPELYPHEMRYGTEDEFADVLRRMLLDPPPPGTARDLAEGYTFDKLMPRYAQLLEDVAAGKGSRTDCQWEERGDRA